MEYPYPSAVEVYTNKANSYKKSVEAALGGKVVINLVDAVDLDGWYYAGYYANYGYEANYDVYDVSGWVRTLVIRALTWIPCFRTTKDT